MAALTVVGGAVAVADVALITVSWKSRSVLAGVLGASSIALVAVALARLQRAVSNENIVLVAALILGIGIVLDVLGLALWQVLDDDPDDAG